MSKVSDQQEDLLTDYGTATTAHLLMAMSIDSLERRNKQLEDENAKLREELESVGTAAYLYGRSDLKTENAKLRELVLIAIKYCDSCTCDGCPIQGEDESCPYSDMARELGVEVEP